MRAPPDAPERPPPDWTPNVWPSGEAQIPAAFALDGASEEGEVAAEAVEEWPEGVTTAMLRNIACRFTKEDVAEVLDAIGLSGKYDGIRVPRKPKMQSNLGYAFVNFTSKEHASLCHALCHGQAFGQSFTTKLCEVVPAHIQGGLPSSTKTRKRSNRKAAAARDQAEGKEASKESEPAAEPADTVDVIVLSF